MKRAQIVEPSKPLVISEVAIPDPPAEGLVVKTTFSGICHTDIHQWDNEIEQGRHGTLRLTDFEYYKLPIVPGHEIAGTVYSLGSKGESDLKVGDPVIVYPWIGCGECSVCQVDSYKCPSTLHQIGMKIPGGYSSFVVVREKKYAVKIPDHIPMHVACMFACSGLTTFNAVSTVKPFVETATSVKGKAKVLIIGAGGLGLWSLQIAKSMLPSSSTVISADISEEKLKVARERGCDGTLCWDPALSHDEVVKKSIKDGAFDAIIDYVGNSRTSNIAFDCLTDHGILTFVGLFGGEANVSVPSIILKSKAVKGVYVGNLQCMKDMMELFSTAKLVPPPITYYKLEEATSVLQKLKEGKMRGRGIINFQDKEYV